MNGLARGSWQYATLLIVLFATAALAVHSTLLYLTVEVEMGNALGALKATTYAIWAITLGFMLIAAAFGLWAIRFSAIAESRLRIAQLVQAMDTMNDGLVLTDETGTVISSNSAISQFIATDTEIHVPLAELFPLLSKEQLASLASSETPTEFELETDLGNGPTTQRFRSQPSGTLNLVFVSDVTSIHDQQRRNRQSARFQLIGQLAKDVAHDFNNILCGISGHAALLAHLKKDAIEIRSSLESIQSDADKGIALAGHLMLLGDSGVASEVPGGDTSQHLEMGATMLRADLSTEWRVRCEIEPALPGSSLSGVQIEQLVYHIGMFLADKAPRPGDLRLTARQAGSDPLADVSADFALVLLMSLHNCPPQTELNAPDDESSSGGVLMSVMNSLIAGVGGVIEVISDFPESSAPAYRVSLPFGEAGSTPLPDDLPRELRAYLSRWTVLAATRDFDQKESLRHAWDQIGLQHEWADNVISTLARIEEHDNFDAIVIERDMFGEDGDAILKAIVKLCPTSGVVVLHNARDDKSPERQPDLIYLPIDSKSDKICTAMIEARSIAAHRLIKHA